MYCYYKNLQLCRSFWVRLQHFRPTLVYMYIHICMEVNNGKESDNMEKNEKTK